MAYLCVLGNEHELPLQKEQYKSSSVFQTYPHPDREGWAYVGSPWNVRKQKLVWPANAFS